MIASRLNLQLMDYLFLDLFSNDGLSGNRLDSTSEASILVSGDMHTPEMPLS